MKKFIVIGGIVGAVLLALGTAGMIFARVQSPTGITPGLRNGGNEQGWGGDSRPGNRNRDNFGPGMMGKGRNEGTGRGMMGQGRGFAPGMLGRSRQDNAGPGMLGYAAGPMQQYVINGLAEKLDLTPTDLQTRIANGETPYQIAQSQGLNDVQIRDLFLTAHDAALDQAVKDGVLTKEQAERMDQQMEQMGSNGNPGFGLGFGSCRGGYVPGWKP